MPRLHEEWLTEVVENLGMVAKHLADLGDGPTLREALGRLGGCVASWGEWSLAETVDGKLHVEEVWERRRNPCEVCGGTGRAPALPTNGGEEECFTCDGTGIGRVEATGTSSEVPA